LAKNTVGSGAIPYVYDWAKKNKLLLLLLSMFFLICFLDFARYAGRIYPGVYVKDVHLGHKTRPEAEKTLSDLQMTFRGPGGSESLLLEEIGVVPIYEQIISTCLQKGREHPWPLNCLERARLKKIGIQVPLSYRIEKEKLSKAIKGLKKSFEREAKNAYYNSNFTTLTPEQFGYRLQEEKLAREIIKNLEQKDAPLITAVPVEELSPNLTLAHLAEKGIIAGVASFTTSFDASNINRTHNITLAAAELDQLLIAPGQIFSFNGILGDTTPAKGYREGIVIQDGKYVAGYGGGVCQVSSTLYNVALLAGLKILERHHHRYETNYACAGRDATIFYGSRDLKFKNIREHYMLISTRVEDGEITIAMAGTPRKEKIEIITKQTSLLEPYLLIEETSELAPGEIVRKEGSPGGRVEVWRATTYAGGEKTEELLFVDNYMPYPAIIRKGEAIGTNRGDGGFGR
jgi:vancomycin resistance protein YoaR